MPGINYSQPILGAGASARTDFAAAKARTGLNFQGAARFKRGIKAELGVEAFADASAELSKFVRGSIEGTAFARAKAGVQLQLPLNLFDEFGFAARAEAIAEAAAGLQADLGLSIGDFVLLAQRDQDLIGLPLELLLLFLEEVSIGGAFEVNVSASAKAHASITISGCVIEKAGQKAGFFYTVDAGVGLAAGAGMGLKAGAEFTDFRRFYGRATDKSVDATVGEIVKLLPAAAKNVVPILQAFAPVAKIALRIAHDVGRKIAENNPGASKQDMNTLCNEVVKTIIEECQRFIFQKMLDSALDTIRNLLERQVSVVGQAAWDGAIQERTSLANQLLAMPQEPFQPTQPNIEYWKVLIARAADLLAKLYGNQPDPRLVEAMSILFCASELMLEAIRSKLNKTSAYAMAIGAGTVSADPQPFEGALPAQPIRMIKRAINAGLSAAPNRDLSYADLLQFLVDDLIVNRLLAAFPEANQFMSIFKHDFGKAENEILKLFLQNAGSFIPAAGSAEMDPHETLRLIVSSLDRFVADKFRAVALPKILDHVQNANTRLYIEEVLFEAVVYIKDVALKSILNWEGKTFDNDDFTEALAGVMTLLLGRTVVIVADTFLTAAQEKIGESCDEIADKIKSGHSDVQILNLPADPDFIRLVADCVKIGGEVLGPLPADTRGRVRQLLYQVFETIPPGAEQDFLENLADQFFIPNREQLSDLTDKLAAISRDRFGLFAEKFVLAVGNYILEQLEELLLQVVDLVVNWEKHLANALEDVAAALANLEAELARLNLLVITAFRLAESGLRDFFDVLSGASLKSQIKAALKDVFVDKALGALEDNDIYKTVPQEFRSAVRSNLASLINGLMNNPIVDPVLDAVRTIADSLEDLLLDCRELDPDENLPEQVMLLVLDRIEDNIRRHFGGTRPHLTIGLDFVFTDLFGSRHSVQIDLGRIDMNVNPFLNLVRDTIQGLDFYHDQLNSACITLAGALAIELQIAAAELRKRQKQADKRRLNALAADHDNGPREIAVLNPTNLSHHSKAIDFKIHLGGVPLSFLGLEKDEIQRVLIYLNGELVPVKSLLVEGSTTINTQRQNEGVRYVFGSSKYSEHAIARGVQALAGKKDPQAATLEVTSSEDGKGRMVSQYAITNTLPGRGNAASRINAFLNDRMAGVLLQFRVEAEDLVQGVNVLTVAVIEKGGNRHQQNVSFTAAKAKIQKPTKPIPGVPQRPRRITLKPTSLVPIDKQAPKKPVMLALKHSESSDLKPETVNTLLPIDSQSLAKKKQAALEYLQEQNTLNFTHGER